MLVLHNLNTLHINTIKIFFSQHSHTCALNLSLAYTCIIFYKFIFKWIYIFPSKCIGTTLGETKRKEFRKLQASAMFRTLIKGNRYP